jgi:hypothetical protein
MIFLTAIALAGCPADTLPEKGDAEVSALDLTELLTAPVKGAAAQSVFAEQSQYTGTIVWKQGESDHSGVFAASTVYRAVLTLTAQKGYRFSFTEAGSFTYTGAAITQSGNTGASLTVAITFPATVGENEDTPVTAANLTALVTAPVKGAAAQTAFTEQTQYTGTIVWKQGDVDHSGTFAASTVYKAVVTLTAKSGFTFTGAGTFTHDGAANVTQSGNTGASLAVAITFPATAAEPGGQTGNQKLNLDPPAMPGGGSYNPQQSNEAISRIDAAKALGWPAAVGEGVVAMWPDDKKGTFTVTVDDNKSEDYAQWITWKNDYGIPATFFVRAKMLSELTGASANMAKEAALIAAGHSVQSHTWFHYDNTSDLQNMTAEESRYDYTQSQTWIQSKVPPQNRVLVIAFSNGIGNDTVAREMYIAARGVYTGDSAINRPGKINYNHVSSDSISTSSHSTKMTTALNDIVDPSKTARYGGWYSVHAHGLGNSSQTLGAFTTLFGTVLGRIESPTELREKLWIDTFVNVAMYGQERDSAALTVTVNEAACIKYTLTDEMDDTVFDYPLTVKFKVPAAWTTITAVQGGQNLPCETIEESGSKYVLVKTVPDRGEVTIVPANAPAPALTRSILEKAFAHTTLVYFNTGSNPGYSSQENFGSMALFYLSLAEYLEPGIQSNGGVFAKDRALAHIRNLISGGKEPHCSNGPFWAHGVITSALTMAKKTGTIWNALSAAEKSKVDLLMKSLAISVNWGYNDVNDFRCGLNLAGNFKKSWNPNYRCSYIPGIVNAVLYFGGADAVNAVFTGFNYDTFTAELSAAGFTNITTTWANAGKTRMESGGTITAGDGQTGSGQGVKAAFRYGNKPLSDIFGIMQNLVSYTYQSTVTSTYGTPGSGYAYIIDGTQSPFQGQSGMLYEFASTDADGFRSDAEYCAASFDLLVPAVTLLKLFGGWDGSTAAQQQMDALMAVGNEDLIYKLEHGYHSWSKGVEANDYENTMQHGYPLAKDVWRRVLNHVNTDTTIRS